MDDDWKFSTFKEAAAYVAKDAAIVEHEAFELVRAAVTGGGVTIRDGAARKTWHDLAGRSFGTSGPLIEEGWRPLEFVPDRYRNNLSDDDDDNGSDGSTFTEFDRIASREGRTFDLEAIVKVINREFGRDGYALTLPSKPTDNSSPVVDTKVSVPTSVMPDRSARGGRNETKIVSDLKVALGAHLAASGLPKNESNSPAELVLWCQDWCAKRDIAEPAKSTIEKIVATVLQAHRDALGIAPKT